MALFKAFIQKIQPLKEKYLNRYIISYLICIVIASILWFLNALSKEYTTKISYPVKYINFPENKYPIAQLPSQIQLKVKAQGFVLLGHRIRTSFLPVTFDVSSYCNPAPDKKDIVEFTLNTNDIKDKISHQLSKEIVLQSVSPETILFCFAHSESKKVPVIPTVNYTLKRQYIVNKITVNPDSIWVQGPRTILDTLQGIPTQEINLKNINKTTTRKIELAPTGNCLIPESPVEVTLQVEQFTEAQKNIPLTPLNVPDSLNLRLFPDNINISYEIGLSKYEKITATDFIFAVDYPKSNETPYLDIKVIKAPAFIKNLSFSPQKVEYILEKKQ